MRRKTQGGDKGRGRTERPAGSKRAGAKPTRRPSEGGGPDRSSDRKPARGASSDRPSRGGRSGDDAPRSRPSYGSGSGAGRPSRGGDSAERRPARDGERSDARPSRGRSAGGAGRSSSGGDRPSRGTGRSGSDRPSRGFAPREGSSSDSRPSRGRTSDNDSRGSSYTPREKSGDSRPSRGRSGDSDRPAPSRDGERKDTRPFRERNAGSERDNDRSTPKPSREYRSLEHSDDRERASSYPKRRDSGSMENRNTYDKRYKSKSRSSASDDDGDGSRLNKFIANTGICSRREADELIKAGAVSVNGVVVTELGTKISPTDTVHYGGDLLRREKMVYVLLNKPKDYITTTDDPEKRRTIMELVHGACKERIYPVGRLDRATTGLLLLTNDGDLTKRLTHPSHGVKKIYHVELSKNLKIADFDRISAGMDLEDGPVEVDKISYVGEKKNEVGIELHSGKNRIVRRIFEALDYEVMKLDRVYFAGLTKKDLPRGRWRKLDEEEVAMLKMMVGADKKAKVGKSLNTKGKRRE